MVWGRGLKAGLVGQRSRQGSRNKHLSSRDRSTMLHGIQKHAPSDERTVAECGERDHHRRPNTATLGNLLEPFLHFSGGLPNHQRHLWVILLAGCCWAAAGLLLGKRRGAGGQHRGEACSLLSCPRLAVPANLSELTERQTDGPAWQTRSAIRDLEKEAYHIIRTLGRPARHRPLRGISNQATRLDCAQRICLDRDVDMDAF